MSKKTKKDDVQAEEVASSAEDTKSVVNPSQSGLKFLILKGKEQGYLTYAEVNDHLPDSIVDPEQIEEIVTTIGDMGIKVYEKAPDEDSLVLAEETTEADDDAAEEAAAALTNVDNDFGRTTDPVRMYMREMGTVELLTREGEIEIAIRIEEGLYEVLTALSEFPASTEFLLDFYAKVEAEEKRLTDLISDYVDPNAERHVIPEPAPIVTPESKEEAERKAAEAAENGDDEEEEERARKEALEDEDDYDDNDYDENDTDSNDDSDDEKNADNEESDIDDDKESKEETPNNKTT